METIVYSVMQLLIVVVHCLIVAEVERLILKEEEEAVEVFMAAKVVDHCPYTEEGVAKDVVDHMAHPETVVEEVMDDFQCLDVVEAMVMSMRKKGEEVMMVMKEVVLLVLESVPLVFIYHPQLLLIIVQ
jgi:hypothetical protein